MRHIRNERILFQKERTNRKRIETIDDFDVCFVADHAELRLTRPNLVVHLIHVVVLSVVDVCVDVRVLLLKIANRKFNDGE